MHSESEQLVESSYGYPVKKTPDAARRNYTSNESFAYLGLKEKKSYTNGSGVFWGLMAH